MNNKHYSHSSESTFVNYSGSESDIESDSELPHRNLKEPLSDSSSSDEQIDQSDLNDSLDYDYSDHNLQQDQKYTRKIQNLKQYYSDDSEEEDSSDAYNRYFQNKIHTIREDPGEGSEDYSMDYIEQRIKKLERDLEDRLNKHQQQTKIYPKKYHGKIISKASAHPPIPNKRTIEVEKRTPPPKPYPPVYKKVYKKSYPPVATYAIQKQKKTLPKYHPQESKMEQRIPTKSSVYSVKKSKKSQRVYKSPKKDKEYQHVQILIQEKNYIYNKLSALYSQFLEIKLENQILKQKLEEKEEREKQSQKQREKNYFQENNRSKSKNKTVQQLERAVSYGAKLYKELYLLDIIEKLQRKLKKSIAKKLGQQSNSASVLMSKGMPANLH